MANLFNTHTSLRTILKGMDEIEKRESELSLFMTEWNSKRDVFSQEYIDKLTSAKREEVNNLNKKTAQRISDAVDYLENNKELSEQKLDFNSASLQNALTVINTLGNGISFNDCYSILDSFRGDFPTLKLLGQTFKKNGVSYGEKYAEELTAPLSSAAIENLNRSVSNVLYGISDNSWSRPWDCIEFARFGERLGLDFKQNPYMLRLKDLSHADEPAGDLLADVVKKFNFVSSNADDSTETDAVYSAMIEGAISDLNAHANDI